MTSAGDYSLEHAAHSVGQGGQCCGKDNADSGVVQPAGIGVGKGVHPVAFARKPLISVSQADPSAVVSFRLGPPEAP